ncbi:MAG: polymer-forming cytoskeletal protein, partial [Rhodospirillales bacterium]|nr:polymer-forming cytoskeletal protein [Rhodospirillales bacterium]
MMVANVRQFSAMVGSMICLLAASVHAQEFDEQIVKTGLHEGHLFLSGEDVFIRAEVKGDAVALADDLEVESVVSGDLYVMAGDMEIDSDVAGEVLGLGGSAEVRGRVGNGVTILGGGVELDGEVGGSVFLGGVGIETAGRFSGPTKLMGAKITHSATVDGDLLAVAAKVEVTEESAVSGQLWATGAKVEVDGVVGGEVRIAARKAVVGGRIEGNVSIDAVEIEILPSAVIAGELFYRSSRQAEIHSGATIVGDVNFERSDKPERRVGMAHAGIAMGLLATVGGLILLGAVQILICPNFSIAAARNIGRNPWKSLGLGFAVLVAGPVLILILIGLVIGFPLGIALIALYILMKLAGLLVASTAIGIKVAGLFGRSAGDTFWQRFGVLVLGVLILAVVTIIPVLGVIVFSVTVILGVGALMIKGHEARQA